MTSSPAPPVEVRSVDAPKVAWLVPLAGIVAVVGAILPWFEPIGYLGGRHSTLGITAHAWQGGSIGIIGPVLLVIIGVLVLRLLVAGEPVQPGKNPVRRDGVLAILFAVLCLGCQLLARALILHADVTVGDKTFHLDNLAARAGLSAVSRGTQLGFWLTAAAAVIALIGGIAMVVAGKPAAGADPPVFAS